ncbi:uncharacterized protein LOC124817609 isoform X2 [Hydra vulgaris]|uniref:Uncharacterized protein LOC124817609 isoform X2 n=1 Tax=Hydra vulgaris TaxID=6087 RepID=A0ABM4CCN7_HYDVU
MAVKMYIRAVWLENGEKIEGTAPECWAIENFLCWPSSLNVINCFNEMREPQANWHRFKLLKIKCRGDRELCDNFEFATTSDTQVESDSDYEEPLPFSLKRKQSKTKNNKQVSKQVSTPVTQVKKKKVPTLMHTPHVEAQDQQWQGFCKEKDDFNIVQSQGGACAFPQKRKELSLPETPLLNSLKRKATRKDASLSGKFPLTEEKFQKKVICALAEMKEMLAKALSANENNNNTNSPEVPCLNSLKSFSDYDCSLSDSQVKSEVVKKLSKIGGETIKKNTKNVMQRLMTNGLQSKFNMAGGKGKEKFEGTNICEVVVGKS